MNIIFYHQKMINIILLSTLLNYVFGESQIDINKYSHKNELNGCNFIF